MTLTALSKVSGSEEPEELKPTEVSVSATTATLRTPSPLIKRMASRTVSDTRTCATAECSDREGRSDSECRGVDKYECHVGAIGERGTASSSSTASVPDDVEDEDGLAAAA